MGSPVRPQSPSCHPKTLNFNKPGAITGSINIYGEDNVKLSERFKQNYILFMDNKKYNCHENDLKYVEELGSGSCGHVAKMYHIPTGKMIAVKQMRRSGNEDETKRIAMDLDVLLKCYSCEHIVQCCGYLIKDTEVWICMELMATCFDKLLKKLRQPIPEPILGKVAVATVKALHYLKENHGVIHRDVKPSNILLNENGDIKLCDFGISGRLVDSKAKTRQAGCAAYMAPERIDPPDPQKPSYDIRADVWSLGISLVELATGKFPYSECKTDFEVLTKIIETEPPSLPNNGSFSPEFCSFVRCCLTKDYKKRPKYKKLLEHPFIKANEQRKVDVSSWFKLVKKPEESVKLRDDSS
ncbi:Dual specificity mitogen-activated protein kinase kinase 7-like protein [Leptotrombidium deliense]|uniref:mitogen-activated protein kinase kinase n=1 Tax=Leptotrombidium deliense TaxID=299467 RepID=A0A443SRX4_9ACAR|nr:Dual specificity mitogen-activated protein kinase kinase 7-like protein [Leptotrombidium deliense]